MLFKHQPSALSLSINAALKEKNMAALVNIFNNETSLNITFLEYHGIDGDDVELIAKALEINNTINSIRFVDIQVGDIGARSIGDLLTKNVTIKELELLNCRIGATGVKYLSNGIRDNGSLDSLHLFGINDFRDLGMAHLSSALLEHPSITALVLSDEKLNKYSCGTFGNTMSTMQKLNLVELCDYDLSDFDKLDGLMLGLANNNNIKTMFLRRVTLTSESVPAIAKMISTNNSLETLEILLRDDSISEKAIVYCILNALKHNTKLKSLVIDCYDAPMVTTLKDELSSQSFSCKIEIEAGGINYTYNPPAHGASLSI